MPIHLVSAALERVFAWETYPTLAACAVSAIVLKRWSAGVDLLARLDSAALDKKHSLDRDDGDDEQSRIKSSVNATIVPRRELRARDLHGNVILIVGGFTSQGLLVCSQLSALGAQLILLTPSLQSERTLQLIHLLRDGTSNPLIYAEECDVTSLASIEAFAAMWNLGEGKGSAAGGVGAGPAGGLSGSTGLGSSANGNRENGTGQDAATAPRRVDALIFLPLDETRHAIGDSPHESKDGVEVAHGEMMGRFHLVNLLLPSMLLLPPHRDIRVISLVSPWYAAGTSSVHLDDLELIKGNGKRSRWPARSPWRSDGLQALLWLSLSRELQRRIQLMADADKRPRTKLPGIDDTGRPVGLTPTNVNIVNVCAGFERGRDVLDYLLPSAGHGDQLAVHDGTAIATESHETEGSSSAVQAKHQQLRELVNQRQARRKGSKEKEGRINTSRSETEEDKLEALSRNMDTQLGMTSANVLAQAMRQFLGLVVVLLLWPLAWLLCKSPKRAAETVTWATIAPIICLHGERSGDFEAVKRNVKLLQQATEDAGGAPIIVPGELHREGKVIQAAVPLALQPQNDGPQKLWDAVEARAKSIVAKL